ncbi:MAG: murein biosynthesis integral membrane protein MurJ [Bdellovibrionaceae bacterium]|nr:murein biosynthesis integral membrane protein MurJ [Pseudobdellovibrionaceae bacterium]
MKKHAFLVGLGIFLSRITGLVRERVFAHYFGNSDAGDAFKAALKIPNFLQNLFGEGVLSASFIPVYAKLLAEKHDEEAAKVASVVASLLFVVTSVLVVAGVFFTPILIPLIAPGFSGEKRELTIRIVQILFPGTGFLVMSAWCLGVLNSHKKFFLSYVAPVVWNFSIIGALLIGGNYQGQSELAMTASYGLVVGSFLQFMIQLPFALKLAKKIKPSLDTKLKAVKTVVRNFVPVVISRGVVQISAYIDNILASLLPTGAVSALAYAQTLYLLPVSLFGMSVSVAELPAMSQAKGTEQEVYLYLRQRLDRGLAQVAFFIVPSVIGFLFFGDLIVAAIFQTGQFDKANTLYVWSVLSGATIGLLPSTLGRLYSSAFFSLRDTRTPLRFAIVRVLCATGFGILGAFYFPEWLGIDTKWGTMNLAVAGGIAGWIEFIMLRRAFNIRVGATGLYMKSHSMLWFCALTSAAVALGVKSLLKEDGLVIVRSGVVLVIYGALYFFLGAACKIEQSQAMIKKLRRIF